jgi:hypothetical protein
MSASPHVTRRLNVLSLFQQFMEERIAAGDSPKGLESAFAQRLDMSNATWSMARSGSRPIGDKLARQIESRCGRPAGWLDVEREPQGLTPAEQQFLALALQTWRATDSRGRKALRHTLKTWGQAQ